MTWQKGMSYMNIMKTTLNYNHQVPCSDGTYVNTYQIYATINVKEEELILFYTIQEGSLTWGHSSPYDKLGEERPGLLTPQDYQLIFSDPKIKEHIMEVEKKLGILGKSALHLLTEEESRSYDYVAFYNHCRIIARELQVGFREITFDELGMCSYHAVSLDLKEESIFILCNDYNIAFTRELNDYPITNIELQQLAKYFPPPYKIWTSEALKSPFQINRPLTQWEKYSINHWKPQTMGDFLFNYWD